MNHPTDTNHPEFFFRPGFADAVQELWADDIIPVLFDSPSYLPLADNADLWVLLSASRLLSCPQVEPSCAHNRAVSCFCFGGIAEEVTLSHITIGATLGRSPCATLDVMLMTLPYSFFPDAHRLTSKEYIPSNDDILRAPVATRMGVTETCFTMGQISLCLCHVTTQSGERKKWIHAFESVTSIIFCTSLPDYDRRDVDGEGRICLPFALIYMTTDCRRYYQDLLTFSDQLSIHGGSSGRRSYYS